MENVIIIDQLHDEIEPQHTIYAMFWQRVGATLLDALILAPVSYGLTYYILIYVKSLFISLCIPLLLPVYKCFMEKKYGATFGKKIMHIYVVSENGQELKYKEVVSRNYYYFLALIMAFSGYYFLYAMPDFQVATTFGQVWALKSDTTIFQKIVKYTTVGLFYIDNLLMLNNSRNQTLHDRLGKTLVIKK